MNLLKIYVLFIFLNIKIRGAEMFSQWDCYYRSDGDVSYCYNMTQLDTSQLTANIQVYTYADGSKKDFDVTATDIWGWYKRCSYDWHEGWSDGCEYVVVVPTDTEFQYVWCVYKLQDLHITPKLCSTHKASRVCLLTLPSTNRLLHKTIPPPVYITGLIFNILIIAVLYFKVDKSVLNFLLLMLSVWDLLYLGCLVVESIIGHYTYETQIQISDVGYALLSVRCELGDFSACDVQEQWHSADNNIEIKTHYYPLMYWLHVAALVFQMASVYQTTVIATFRCIAILRPFKANQLLTSTTAAVATGGCLLLGVAVHVSALIAGEAITAVRHCMVRQYNKDFNYNECLSNITSAQNPLVSASTTSFTYLHHHYHIITYSIILFLALPFLLLLVLNILMMAALYRGSGALHDDENKAVTKVVAAIVTVFLITYIIKPLYIVDIYYFSGHIMNTIAFQSCGGYFTASLLITIMPAINSVVNLLLYLGLRATFRQKFASMFHFCKQDEIAQSPETILLQPVYR